MYAMYIPLNIGLHWVLCEVVLPRTSTSEGEKYPTGKLKIYDSLHGAKGAYTEVMNLLIEHLGYVWASRGYADQRDGDEGRASLQWNCRGVEVHWCRQGQRNARPSQYGRLRIIHVQGGRKPGGLHAIGGERRWH
jgi:hypothetical protein